MTSPSSAGSVDSIPGRGAKIPHASWPKNQNIKQKQYCNKFSKDFKNSPHEKKTLKKRKEKEMTHIMLSFFKLEKNYLMRGATCITYENFLVIEEKGGALSRI